MGRSLSTVPIILLICLTCSTTTISQQHYDSTGLSADVRLVVDELASYGGYRSEKMMCGNCINKQWNVYQKLKAIASKDVLVKLTNHPQASIRCYAFEALACDSTVDVVQIIAQHLCDTTGVETMYYDVIDVTSVGDFFIYTVGPIGDDKNVIRLNSKQTAELDSLLLFSDCILHARTMAFERAEPKELYYERVRYLLLSQKVPDAAVLLAKYHKIEDMSLILQYSYQKSNKYNPFYYAYRAIQRFPHSAFLDFLRSQLLLPERSDAYQLIAAILAIGGEESLEMLLTAFNCRHGYDFSDALFKNVEHYNDPKHDTLLMLLWKVENRLSAGVFKRLLDHYPHESLLQAGVSLLHPEMLKVSDRDRWYKDSLGFHHVIPYDSLFICMFSTLLQIDTAFPYEVIRRHIKNAGSEVFRPVAYSASLLKHPSFVEPLFERLRSESNPHVFLPLVECLLAYKSEDIKTRILAERVRNSALQSGWGAEKLDRLLNEGE